MKNLFFPALKLTLLSVILLCGIYTLLVLGIGKLLPGGGRGEVISHNGKTYYANIGQLFTEDRYFWSRPSAVDYNAAGSGGSNKGPTNPELLQTIQARLDTFLTRNPGVNAAEVPVDLITASGSGLDPNISPQAAYVQARRIAAARKFPETTVRQLIAQQVEGPLLGLFGPPKINVLKLNLALDTLASKG